jgi:hypothetical protein
MILSPEVLHQQNEGKLVKDPGLSRLAELEQHIQLNSPLPVSYDVNRPQPWYFTELAYTEMLGALYIYPMNHEMACRLVEDSVKQTSGFDPAKVIMARLEEAKTLDKYQLSPLLLPGRYPIVILPGSNQLTTHVDRGALARLIWERPDTLIKPHPLTDDRLLSRLGREFGVSRILPANASGWAAVDQASEVYCSSTTELALYAALRGIPVKSIANIFFERSGSYFPFFRLIVDKPSAYASQKLLKILSSPISGVVFAEDPDWPYKIDKFIVRALKLRSRFKPRIFGSFDPMPTQKTVKLTEE